MISISSIDASRPSFQRNFKKLNPGLQGQAREAIKDLLKDPIPNGRRFEKLKGYKNPNIYTVHVTGNHSHKLSFEVADGVAILRHISTHRDIDRRP